LHAAKGNAALVKLIFDYHEGPPPQKHELTEFVYQGSELRQTLRRVGELMRDFVPRERWGELAERIQEIDRATTD
jgi:hypothetical protein